MTSGFPIMELASAGVAVLDCEHKTPAPCHDGFPYIAIPDVQDGRVVIETARRISASDFEEWTRRTVPQTGDIIVTRRARVGDTAPIPDGIRCAIGQNLVLLRSDESQLLQTFLRWAVRSPQWWSEVDRLMNVGAVFSSLNVRDIAKIKLPLPAVTEQLAITEVLSALDDKIAANTKVVGLLDAHMGLQYTAAILTEASVVALDEVAEFHNRKRVPLSAREREERPGNVPYYGASGVFGTVDTALFDEPLVLVGEDGSVINDDGTPVSQYIWGPAWVNNHAHVLTGKGISTELLFLAVRRTQVVTLVTGAVQPKINMGNLKRLTLEIPSMVGRDRLQHHVNALTASKRAAIEENRSLAATRDALLPQLMSGKLRVKDAEALVAAAV